MGSLVFRVLCLVAAYGPRASTLAGLVFSSPATLAGLESPRCVPVSVNGNTTQGPYAIHIGKVDSDFCGVVCGEGDALCLEGLTPSSVFGGRHFNTDKYKGLTPVWGDVKERCSDYAPDRTEERLRWGYDLAVANNCHSLIDVYTLSSERKRVPGFTANLVTSITAEIPFVQCEWVGNLDAGAFRPAILGNAKSNFSGSANFTIDENPWLRYFESPLYQWVCCAAFCVLPRRLSRLYFRGWGVAYLCFSVFTALCLRVRLGKPSTDKVPEVLLLVECTRSTILGFHFIIGSLWADGNYPSALHVGLFSQLGGLSMCSSLLSGIFFAQVASMTAKSRKSAGFWRKNKRKLLFLTVLCFALDIVAFVCSMLNVAYAEFVVAGLMTIASAIIGMNFVINSFHFVSTISNTLQSVAKEHSDMVHSGMSANSSAMLARVRFVAMWLFISACFILIYVLMAPIIALSGSLIFGIYSPSGFTTFWVFGNIVIFIPSFAQVTIARERKKQKKKKGEVAPATSVVSSVAVSTAQDSYAAASTSVGETSTGTSLRSTENSIPSTLEMSATSTHESDTHA